MFWHQINCYIINCNFEKLSFIDLSYIGVIAGDGLQVLEVEKSQISQRRISAVAQYTTRHATPRSTAHRHGHRRMVGEAGAFDACSSARRRSQKAKRFSSAGGRGRAMDAIPVWPCACACTQKADDAAKGEPKAPRSACRLPVWPCAAACCCQKGSLADA